MKFLYLVLLIPGLAIAADQDFNPEDYRDRRVEAVRLSDPLNIDGRLEEGLYSGQSYSDFVQFIPHNGSRASERTEVWIGYDDDALYVGARMWDSEPDSVETRVGRRDEWLNTDIFEVIIDSYHDKRTGYSFQINPSGSILDETYFNDSWTDRTWDGIWEGRTTIDQYGWTAELRIPYSNLRFNEQEVYTWGFFPTRYIQRRNEWDYFVYVAQDESGLMSRAAEMNGIQGISPPSRRAILPYVTAGGSSLPSQQDNPFFEGRDSNLGLGADVKIGIGGNLTIDATINPDFGQVEVDPSVINLSAYETYYQEKRPFFVEGRNIFRFGRGGAYKQLGLQLQQPTFLLQSPHRARASGLDR